MELVYVITGGGSLERDERKTVYPARKDAQKYYFTHLTAVQLGAVLCTLNADAT